MHDVMIETRAGADQPCTLEIRPATGGPPRQADAPLTRQQRRIVDRANAKDARWFALHPDQAQRIRRRIPGEFAPLIVPAECTHVCVVRVGSQRVRLPITESEATA